MCKSDAQGHSYFIKKFKFFTILQNILKMSLNHKQPCLTKRSRSARQRSTASEDYFTYCDSESRMQTSRTTHGDTKTGLYQVKNLRNKEASKFNRESTCCRFEKNSNHFEETHLLQGKGIKFRSIKNKKSQSHKKKQYSPCRYWLKII